MKRIQVYLKGSITMEVEEGTNVDHPEFLAGLHQQFYDLLGERDEETFELYAESR
jgi:hypothetical protein